jgi:hypothetical protein
MKARSFCVEDLVNLITCFLSIKKRYVTAAEELIFQENMNSGFWSCFSLEAGK